MKKEDSLFLRAFTSHTNENALSATKQQKKRLEDGEGGAPQVPDTYEETSCHSIVGERYTRQVKIVLQSFRIY